MYFCVKYSNPQAPEHTIVPTPICTCFDCAHSRCLPSERGPTCESTTSSACVVCGTHVRPSSTRVLSSVPQSCKVFAVLLLRLPRRRGRCHSPAEDTRASGLWRPVDLLVRTTGNPRPLLRTPPTQTGKAPARRDEPRDEKPDTPDRKQQPAKHAHRGSSRILASEDACAFQAGAQLAQQAQLRRYKIRKYEICVRNKVLIFRPV